MLTPYWQLDPKDATRLAWAVKHWIALDPDTGAYLWQGRQRDRYGVTIPAPNRLNNVYLRFRAADDHAAYDKALVRLAKWQSTNL